MKLKMKKLFQAAKFNQLNIYLKYTLLFIIILIIGLLPIEIKNQTFLFSGLFVDRSAGIDGLKQHLIFMNDFISNIKAGLFNGGISLYRFDIGLGSDLINHYTYYSLFDPLLIISYIIPIKYVEFSYYLLILVRLFLSGIAIIFLAKKVGITKDNALLATAIFYAFNVAILFSAFRHPMFINGPMYFALIIYGYEKLKNRENPIVLIISVFLALVSQFYIFIYITFGFVLFTFIDYLKHKKFKLYFRINLYYLLGVLLGGFVLTTQIYATLSGARVGSKGIELYDAIDYAVLIFSNFLPLAGDHYTAGIGNLIVFIVCLYFVINEKKKSTYSIFFITLFFLSFSATFSYLVNATSYVVNRWMFLITLPASIMLGKFIEVGKVEKESTSKTVKVFLILVILGLTGGIVYLVSLLDFTKSIHYLISVLLLVIGILISLRITKAKVEGLKILKLLSSKNLYKYVIYNSIFVLLIVSGIYCFILTPAYSLEIYYGDNNQYIDVLDDNSFYRLEQTTYVAGVSDYSNDGIYYKYPSTASYNTMTNGSIINLIEEYNLINNNNSVGYNGFNYRSRFMAVNLVKYVVIRESESKLPPYGFSFYKEIELVKYDTSKHVYHKGGNILKDQQGNIVTEKAVIYINDLFLNFGVIFDSYLNYEDVKDLSIPEKELLLTKTIIIDEAESEVNKFKITEELPKVIVNDFRLENIIIEDGKMIVEEGGILAFTIPKVENEEVYLEITNLVNVDYNQSFTTRYKTFKSEWVVKNYGYASNMYIENRDHLVNLGYYEDETDLIVEIEFTAGEYNHDEISYYLLPSNTLESEIENLNKNYLSDVEFGKNSFKGKINTNISGYMFIPLPYSKGFSAYIDGEEVNVYKANTGYMAVYVDKSAKELEFIYTTPGLEFGKYLSAISLIALIFVIRYTILKKIHAVDLKEDNNEKNNRFYK